MNSRQRLFRIAAMIGIVGSVAVSSRATVLIDEQFESGYSRTTQNIAGGNMAFYKGRANTTATVNVGSVSFSASTNNGAEGYWAYFTDPGANIAGVGTASSVSNGHLLLGVGDVLTVSIGFRLGSVPADTSTTALRFGIFDDAGTRVTTDLNGGPANAGFVSNPAFATFVPLTSGTSLSDQISIRRRTTLTSSNPLSAAADWTQIDGLVGGTYLPLAGGSNYTFQMTIGRPDASTYVLSAAIIDTLTAQVMTSGSVSTNDGFNSFDFFMWRLPGMGTTTNGGPYDFTRLKVEVGLIPEPSTVALIAVGLGMTAAMLRRRRS